MKDLCKQILNRKKTKTNVFIIELVVALLILTIADYLNNDNLIIITMIISIIIIPVSQIIVLDIYEWNITKNYAKNIICKELGMYIKSFEYNLKKGFSKDLFWDNLKYSEIYRSKNYISGIYNNNKFELSNIEIIRYRNIFTRDFDSPHSSYNRISVYYGDWFIFKLK